MTNQNTIDLTCLETDHLGEAIEHAGPPYVITGGLLIQKLEDLTDDFRLDNDCLGDAFTEMMNLLGFATKFEHYLTRTRNIDAGNLQAILNGLNTEAQRLDCMRGKLGITHLMVKEYLDCFNAMHRFFKGHELIIQALTRTKTIHLKPAEVRNKSQELFGTALYSTPERLFTTVNSFNHNKRLLGQLARSFEDTVTYLQLLVDPLKDTIDRNVRSTEFIWNNVSIECDDQGQIISGLPMLESYLHNFFWFYCEPTKRPDQINLKSMSLKYEDSYRKQIDYLLRRETNPLVKSYVVDKLIKKTLEPYALFREAKLHGMAAFGSEDPYIFQLPQSRPIRKDTMARQTASLVKTVENCTEIINPLQAVFAAFLVHAQHICEKLVVVDPKYEDKVADYSKQSYACRLFQRYIGGVVPTSTTLFLR